MWWKNEPLRMLPLVLAFSGVLAAGLVVAASVAEPWRWTSVWPWVWWSVGLFATFAGAVASGVAAWKAERPAPGDRVLFSEGGGWEMLAGSLMIAGGVFALGFRFGEELFLSPWGWLIGGLVAIAVGLVLPLSGSLTWFSGQEICERSNAWRLRARRIPFASVKEVGVAELTRRRGRVIWVVLLSTDEGRVVGPTSLDVNYLIGVAENIGRHGGWPVRGPIK